MSLPQRISDSPKIATSVPRVSVIVAARNEEAFIGACLDSILNGTYPVESLEVLVIDGMSSDRTREIVADRAQRYGGIVRIFENPARITPVAFNIGVRNATGDLIMIMSAHATYAPNAIKKCVQYSSEYEADNVGGICVTKPRDSGIIPKCIVRALSHRFGVGGSAFRTGGFATPRWSDTAAFGCYRREVFSKIGLYNEKLVYSQDIELNLRLKKAGGKTLLAPDIVLEYSARTGLKSFCQHNFRNGLWAIMPFAYSDVMPVGWRHLVPMAFVLFVLTTSLLAVFVHNVAWVLALGLLAYALMSLAVSAQIAVSERDARYLFLMPVVFLLLHIPYGLGSTCGLIRVAFSPQRSKLLSLAFGR